MFDINNLKTALRVVSLATDDQLLAVWIREFLDEGDLDIAHKLAGTEWGSVAVSRFQLRALILDGLTRRRAEPR
jgi:hypothetical protein